jgi:hypothetical protein
MSDVTSAIAAATSVASSLGLPANDAVILNKSNRLALRMTLATSWPGSSAWA